MPERRLGGSCHSDRAGPARRRWAQLCRRTSPKRSRRSSRTQLEQAVVNAAAEIALRRARRSNADAPKASWSSVKVSPCDDRTRGSPGASSQRGGIHAVGSKTLHVEHIRTEGAVGPPPRAARRRGAAAAKRAMRTDVAGGHRCRQVAHRMPSSSVVPRCSPRSTVHTSTSVPAARSSPATCRTWDSTPPRWG